MSEENPTQKKFRWQTLLIWAAVIVLLAWALPKLGERTLILEQIPVGQKYTVTHNTTLHYRASFRSRVLDDLEVGEIVTDPYGADKLTCKTSQEDGEMVGWCLVVAVEDYGVGWILKKWIE